VVCPCKAERGKNSQYRNNELAMADHAGAGLIHTYIHTYKHICVSKYS
jgi:hypothetical protein